MRINFCGMNMAHDKSFIVNRPGGSGDNLFIYTRTPIIMVSNGKMNRYPAETAVFFRKGLPQHFMAAGHIYANDFIHFDADEEEMAFIDSLGIPSGVPFTDLDPSVFLNIHRYICIEHQSQATHRQTSIDALLKYFLIKLAQAMEDAVSIPIRSSTKNAIYELRSEMFANVGKTYTIEDLAARAGLSESYFQAIYKKMFGRSCMNDIIIARLDRAKSLLLTTDHSVADIAHMCGYENDSHFSRQFKKYMGITAGEFRKEKRQGTVG